MNSMKAKVWTNPDTQAYLMVGKTVDIHKYSLVFDSLMEVSFPRNEIFDQLVSPL